METTSHPNPNYFCFLEGWIVIVRSAMSWLTDKF